MQSSGTNDAAPVITYIGLGSSVGDRTKHLRDALHRLATMGPGVTVEAVSPIYESPHMGLVPGDSDRYPAHYNGVARLSTTLAPLELLARVQSVEAAGGRQRTEKWGPRTIDVDVLLYGDLILHTPALTIPHPGIADRAFVALPLAALAPDIRLPDGRAIADIARSPVITGQVCVRVPSLDLNVS